jgi:hypothetical protein
MMILQSEPGMDYKSAEVIILAIGQIVAAIVFVVTTRLWVTFLAKRVDAHDVSHRDHYSHASNRPIHQESMDAKQIGSEFHAVKNQLQQHAAEDLRVFAEIRSTLKDMRSESQSDLKDIREAVQDVRENMRG